MSKKIIAVYLIIGLIAFSTAAICVPTVNPDRTVTFTFRARSATSVSVNVINLNGPIQMTNSGNGTWTTTVGPLEPNVWEYSFVVDGVTVLDTSNPWVDERLSLTSCLFEVPGDEPSFFTVRDVPHGIVSMHTFRSPVRDEMRTFHVYTPPGYDPAGSETYPVLYLLHGAGNDDRGWTVIGRAHYILDNFIADGIAVPMIVVIPNGQYPLGRGYDFKAYEEDLLGTIMPIIDSSYRVKTDRKYRAMAGLSMGGFQTMNIGVKHQEMFDWLGIFSGGVEPTYEDEFAQYIDTLNDRVTLVWVGNGDNDDVIRTRHDTMTALLDKRKVNYSFTEYSGGHTWDVWRKCFRDFAPLIFR